MIRELEVNLFEVVPSLSRALDLVSSAVVNHHWGVARFACSIAADIGFSTEGQSTIFLAGMLHDSGALSLQQKLAILEFEMQNPHRHAEMSYRLLKNFAPLSRAAKLTRYHHVPWNEGQGSQFKEETVPYGSHILHIADRVDILIDKRQEILPQVPAIVHKINAHSGTLFEPNLVRSFNRVAEKEHFWLGGATPSTESCLPRRPSLPHLQLGPKDLLGLGALFSRLIDFRSPFTANHSSGVAAVAEALALVVGFSEREGRMMRLAGLLHDLGKLAVPNEILEKPGQLSEEERRVVRTHTFFTYRLLETMPDLETVNMWASFHHERLDGTGYPFRHAARDLCLGSRIMGVADIYTALTEHRPYRAAMEPDRALTILRDMAAEGAVDPKIVNTLQHNIEDLDSIRQTAQERSATEYRALAEESTPIRTRSRKSKAA